MTGGAERPEAHYARPLVGYAVGVDVGTTFTAAAVSRNGQVEIVGLGNHSATIPSVVFLREDGELLVGDVAARRAHAEPGRAAQGVQAPLRRLDADPARAHARTPPSG